MIRPLFFARLISITSLRHEIHLGNPSTSFSNQLRTLHTHFIVINIVRLEYEYLFADIIQRGIVQVTRVDLIIGHLQSFPRVSATTPPHHDICCLNSLSLFQNTLPDLSRLSPQRRAISICPTNHPLPSAATQTTRNSGLPHIPR